MANQRRVVALAILLQCVLMNLHYSYQLTSIAPQSSASIESMVQGMDEVSYSAAGWPWSYYEQLERGPTQFWAQWNLLKLACNLAIWGLFFTTALWIWQTRCNRNSDRKGAYYWRWSLAEIMVVTVMIAGLCGSIARNRGEYTESQRLKNDIRKSGGVVIEAFYWPSFLLNDTIHRVFANSRLTENKRTPYICTLARGCSNRWPGGARDFLGGRASI